jgi:alkanesulfonate monooxygenase SsuD/methylene tetrahydromethanopterin reductase-like flavin-dependent oxidoreductase (luciferase family)
VFIRKKTVKGATYYQAVEGYRDAAGRVRHRNVVSLGQCATVDEALAEVKRVHRSLRRWLTSWSAFAIHHPRHASKIERRRSRLAQLQARRATLEEVARRLSS